MPIRTLFLVFLAIATTSGSAFACMDDEDNLGEFQPAEVDGRVVGNPIGSLYAQARAVMILGLLAKGDRWEFPPGGENEQVAWDAQLIEDGQAGPGFVRLRLWGKTPGLAMIPLRYVHANGRSQRTNLLSLRVSPAPPPPPPPTLTVTGSQFSGGVPYGRGFLIRLAKPLTPGDRWEVKEAVYGDGSGTDWKPIEVTAQAEEPGVFTAISRGSVGRIVFVRKRDGWQLFPETVTINLIVTPVPKC